MAGDAGMPLAIGTKADDVIHQFQSSSIQMLTEGAVDPAANVRAANNWNDKETVMAYNPSLHLELGGVIYGVAAPVKTPSIGTVRKP
jgi:hypothetical protein